MRGSPVENTAIGDRFSCFRYGISLQKDATNPSKGSSPVRLEEER